MADRPKMKGIDLGKVTSDPETVDDGGSAPDGVAGEGWFGEQFQYYVLFQPVMPGPAEELMAPGLDGWDVVSAFPTTVGSRVAGPNGQNAQMPVFAVLLKRQIRDRLPQWYADDYDIPEVPEVREDGDSPQT